MHLNKSIIPHFSDCSSVWQNCLKADSKKLEKLNETALRYIFNDKDCKKCNLIDLLEVFVFVNLIHITKASVNSKHDKMGKKQH